MNEVIPVTTPEGTQKLIGAPAEQPTAAIQALTRLFEGIPNVVSARLGLMQLIYPEGRSMFTYTIGIECRANRDWIEHMAFEELKSAPSGRWPISLVPPTATYFTDQAILFYQAGHQSPPTADSSAPAPVVHVKPLRNIDIPIENPRLVRAMERVAREGSDAAKDELLFELQRATYLAANLNLELKINPGVSMLPPGSQFDILTLGKKEKDGEFVLPLFTDWTALKAFTDREVRGLVLPAREAWEFALGVGRYHGVVINPAYNALPLEPPMLRYLLDNVPKT